MRYWVVTASSVGKLQTAVEDALKDGWVLQGGLAIMYDSYTGWLWAQAVVKP